MTIRLSLDEATAQRFDRLMDFLEGRQAQKLQAQIDEQTAALKKYSDEEQAAIERKMTCQHR